MACRFTVECNTCQKPVWSKCTSPKSTRRHDINVRAVVASKECGVPLSTMKTMFSIMNMPNVMHHKTFYEIGLEVREAAIGAAEEVMSASARVIKERHQSNVYTTERSSPSGVQVVNVSYDGTWHKRGHSSHYGVGVAIDVDSGYVLDTYTVSNFCTGCTRAPDPDSPQYLSWFERHKPLCNKNFEGSSNAMETRAAEVIFSRSIECRGLIYGTMLCDGDSKALTRVNDLGVYDIPVQKEDCVNHIAKRIYNQLEQVKKDNKQKLNRKLTAAKIKKITNTYATNLRQNAPDIQKMKLGVMGGLFHMMSTDSAPNHRLCPEGETSWCKHNRALAKGEQPPPHNPTLSPDIGTYVFPIFKRLTDPALLSRCVRMSTQNPNECFNSTIWRRCPKVLFAHLPTIETAVALSVISFNMGPTGLYKVFERLGLTWGAVTNSHAIGVAETRIRHSKRKGKNISKWKRKHLQQNHLNEKDKREEREGVTYSSGAFNC
ncbi:uncharacterized protein LOC118478202 [Aplysia californica]|uniref:Uncharacterized protein LOC118478202 n=1 Tax=Aplysia californica TaxID=6500 RepID=A0ABM1VXR8_APLCA|nr:uncharacterized protein LOC118478202 [Aplysia californica]